MVSIPLYNMEGKKLEALKVDDAVFDVEMNEDLVHQVYSVLTGNRREGLAHTKTQSERAGSGRKPWKQKGTGRARTGSVRNPIWRKGGIIFGPTKDRNFKKQVNVKMRRKAVQMVLSEKVRNGKCVAVQEIPNMENLKTKDCVSLLNKMNVSGSVIAVLDAKEHGAFRALRNIAKMRCVLAQDIDVARLLESATVITSKSGVEALEKRFQSI